MGETAIDVMTVKPGRGVRPGSVLPLFLSVKANISGDGHAKIAFWRTPLEWLLRNISKYLHTDGNY